MIFFHIAYGYKGNNCCVVEVKEVQTNNYSISNDYGEIMGYVYGFDEVVDFIKDLKLEKLA